MTKQKEVLLEIRQAEGLDATLLVDFLDQVGAESDYMTLDEAGIGMTPSDMERFLLLQGRADNRICLLLFLDQQLVGLLNITAAPQRSVRHIGEVVYCDSKKLLESRTWTDLTGRRSRVGSLNRDSS